VNNENRIETGMCSEKQTPSVREVFLICFTLLVGLALAIWA
jgi:hypothetical protein